MRCSNLQKARQLIEKTQKENEQIKSTSTIENDYDLPKTNLFNSASAVPRFIINDPFNNRYNNHATAKPMMNSTLAKKSKRIIDTSPSKSIYELVKQDIKMPEGLQFRGKYVAKTRNKLSSFKGKPS